MKKISGVYTFFIFVLLLTFYIIAKDTPVPTREVLVPEKSGKEMYRQKENELLGFIQANLMGENGEIYTNTSGPSGKETLSESVGLLMNYYIIRDKKQPFDIEFLFLKKSLMEKGSYLKWKTGDGVTCNAAVDDFRILRSLLDAGDKWGEEEYFRVAGLIQEEMLSKQVHQGVICELYDWEYQTKKKSVPLCYLDFYTMDRLRVFNAGWLKVSDASLFIIKNSSLFANGPFIEKYYDFENGRYLNDEEFDIGGGICLTYTLYSMIHMLEINIDTSGFTQWLKNEMYKGKLYAWYNPETLEPTDRMESTAIYALAAVYSKKAGEEKLYYKIINKMMDFSVKDRKSTFYGGFGNKDTEVFYSFDNLTALWALSLVED